MFIKRKINLNFIFNKLLKIIKNKTQLKLLEFK